MKKPTDHFTAIFPWSHWIKNKKAYAWGSATPSRALAYATLLILGKKTGPISHDAVLDWAQRFRESHPTIWHATIVKMFGRNWKQDPRTEVLCSGPIETEQRGGLARLLALSYFLLAAGLESWPQFHGILENTPQHIRDQVFSELKSWPGLEVFFKEVELAILGQGDQVKWLKKRHDIPQIKGFYLRQAQAMHVGDAVTLDPASRGCAPAELQAKINSLLASWAFDLAKKKFFVELELGRVRVTRVH
jgi:hypothetical protein